MYVAIEGIDGSGKTSLVNKLCKRMRDKYGWNVLCTREPHNTFTYKDSMRYADNVEQTLFYALDRYRFYNLYNKDKKDLWLSDRSLFSSYAYQTVDKNYRHTCDVSVPLDWITDVNSYVPCPDMTILLYSYDVRSVIARQTGTDLADILWSEESVDYYTEVNDNYLELSEVYPNWHVLDSLGDQEVIIDKVEELIVDEYYE